MHWLRFRVEISRGSFLKREQDRIEYLSPVPCPFNYGSLEGQIAPDGDAPDVLLLGPPVPRGTLREAPQVGLVRFLDDGLEDHKFIASSQRVTEQERQRVENFFRIYAPIRGWINRMQGKKGETRYLGTVWEE